MSSWLQSWNYGEGKVFLIPKNRSETPHRIKHRYQKWPCEKGVTQSQTIILAIHGSPQECTPPRNIQKLTWNPQKNDTAFFQDSFVFFCKRETNFIRSIFAILKLQCNQKRILVNPNVFPSIFTWKKPSWDPCLEVQVGTIHGLSKESPSAYEAQAPEGRSRDVSCQGFWKIFGAKDAATFNVQLVVMNISREICSKLPQNSQRTSDNFQVLISGFTF